MSDTTPAKGTQPPMQIWGGYTLGRWLLFLARNRFAVGKGCRKVALSNTLGCALSSVLALVQWLRYGRGIARTRLAEDPLFVLGHWRSGTTFLHDLLALDPRHVFPNTYQCFMPHHFLVSETYVKRRFPIQTRRQIDEVEWSWETPQEDEWALTLLGQPSPYQTIAFPNFPPQGADYLDLEDVSPRRREAWKRTLLHFLQAVSYKKPGRLVLKSPTHTARIKVLLEMFPEARFVHVVRNPYQVISSTFTTFRMIYESMGLQPPTFVGLEEMVFSTYQRMFRRLEEGRQLVSAGRFHEFRYEDLVSDPAAKLREMYDHLGLGGFEEMRPKLEEYLARLGNYHAGYHELSPGLREQIAERCAKVIARYGYTPSDSG
jgi:hypothetical protein